MAACCTPFTLPDTRKRFKNDPKLAAAARELRDRYIEQINSGGGPGMLLPPYSGGACSKYDVSRALEAAPSTMKVAPIPGVAMLEAA
jgi:hypothetical protein